MISEFLDTPEFILFCFGFFLTACMVFPENRFENVAMSVRAPEPAHYSLIVTEDRLLSAKLSGLGQ